MKKQLHTLVKQLAYLGYVLVFVVIMLEVLLRILQYEPYYFRPFSIHSEPQQCILPDSTYGFLLNSGQYQVVINQGLTFQATHNSNGWRAPEPPPDLPFTIQIHGCSYTYGFGISDSLTLAYQLQQQLGSLAKIENRAVLGYGTVQSYHLLKEAIDQGKKPDWVVINYASFHDDRNALTPLYRKDLKNGFAQADNNMQEHYQSLRFPYITQLGDSLAFCWDSWDHIYQNWPWREQSALVNVLQTISDKWQQYHIDKQELTNELFLAIHQLCQEHKINLLVAGITPDERTKTLLRYCQSQGLNTIDISVDLYHVAYNNLPYDTHPNGNAHAYFAKKLSNYFQKHTDFQQVDHTNH